MAQSPRSPSHGGRARLSTAILFAILLLALGLRLAAIAVIGPTPSLDGYTESTVTARNMLDGKGYTYDFFGERPDKPLRSFMPPLYVGLVYAAMRWSANPPLALAGAQAVLSALMCGAVYLIAVTLSRRRDVALLAALASALYPVLIVMVTVWTTLILHAAVLLWAVAVTLLLPERPRWGWAALAGALWGLIALGRPALLAFIPLVLLWLWLNCEDRRAWLKLSIVLMAAAVLVILPWTIRNYRVQGRIIGISTNGGATFWNGNNPFTTGSGMEVYSRKAAEYLGRPFDPSQPPIVQMQPYPLPPDLAAQVATISETELDRRQYQAGLEFIRLQPGEWLALVAQKAAGFLWFRRNIGSAYEASWTPYYKVLYASLLAAFAAGLVMSFKDWRRYSLLYLLFAFYLATNLAFSVQTRYRWEIEPLFLVFAALCVAVAARRLADARRLRRARAAASD